MSESPGASSPTKPVQNNRIGPTQLALLLATLGMIGPFTIDAFFPAFHAVQAELKISPALMQQTLSVYLITWGAMALFHGPISDRYGRRNPILFWMLIYTVASFGCAFASSIEALLFYRAIQGMAAGAGSIIGRALTRDLFHGAAAQRVFAMTSFFFGVAPALAPIIGGVIFESAGWHAVFLFLVLYGLIIIGLVWRYLPESHPHEARIQIRPSNLISNYQRIAADWGFIMLGVASGLNFNAQFLYISSAPAFVRDILHLDTAGFSWFFVPMIVGMMSGAFLADRLAGRITPERSVSLGYWIMLFAAITNLGYNFFITIPTVPWAVLPIMVNAFGTALAFPALSLMMIDRHHQQRGSASSLQGFIWAFVATLTSSLFTPIASQKGLYLAIGAASMSLVGWMCWKIYLARERRVVPDINADDVVMESTDIT